MEQRPSLDLIRFTMSNHGREILKKRKEKNPNYHSRVVYSSAEAFSRNTCEQVSPRKRLEPLFTQLNSFCKSARSYAIMLF